MAATTKRRRVAVLGSGNIGCWVGGHIATGAVAEASTVKFLHRSSPTGSALAAAVGKDGLTLSGCVESDATGKERRLPPAEAAAAFTTDAGDVLKGADMVFVCVKRQANTAAAELLLAHADPSATVVCMQNGLGAGAELKALLGAQWAEANAVVLDCVVSSNVVGAETGGSTVSCPTPVPDRGFALGTTADSMTGREAEACAAVSEL
jgi:2-dehydropantoate 2-reductase